MTRRSRIENSNELRQRLINLLVEFEHHLRGANLRQQVRELVPATHILRDLGSSLIRDETANSARDRILSYLQKHVGQVIDGDELMVVAGISEYARRIRELRVEGGWPILSGHTARDLCEAADGETFPSEELPPEMGPDQYVLQDDRQDLDAAHRWHTANQIRKSSHGIQEKLLAYFRVNVGRPITSEELRYVANDRSEWARRTRELRTEEGWPIVTRYNGNPMLPVGVYVLARDEQVPEHDRHIKEITRREVMERDVWRCRWRGCGWSKDRYDHDARYLELHHIVHHLHGGSNEKDNLVTLCNLHHDEVHRTGVLDVIPPP